MNDFVLDLYLTLGFGCKIKISNGMEFSYQDICNELNLEVLSLGNFNKWLTKILPNKFKDGKQLSLFEMFEEYGENNE